MVSNPQKWIAVTTLMPRGLDEQACAILANMNSKGMEISDEQEETVRVTLFFENIYSPSQLIQDVQDFLDIHFPQTEMKTSSFYLEDQNWVAMSRDSFRPNSIGEHFLVHPSWEKPSRTNGRICLQLDPQEAFGSGSHETTMLCIMLMEKHFQSTHRRCLDVGFGSGILLLALEKWIERMFPFIAEECKLVGIDIDGPSVEVARKNLELNEFNLPVELHHLPLETFQSGPFDFIFANMLSGILLRNLEQLFSLLASAGKLIMTGFLVSEEAEMRTELGRLFWKIIDEAVNGEWMAFVISK